jgi:hypothetical protein
MNTIMKWALRSVALWAVAKTLELLNEKLRQRQGHRRLRAQAQRAAALPRASTYPTVYPEGAESREEPTPSIAR